jgi:hypothetical protein
MKVSWLLRFRGCPMQTRASVCGAAVQVLAAGRALHFAVAAARLQGTASRIEAILLGIDALSAANADANRTRTLSHFA